MTREEEWNNAIEAMEKSNICVHYKIKETLEKRVEKLEKEIERINMKLNSVNTDNTYTIE